MSTTLKQLHAGFVFRRCRDCGSRHIKIKKTETFNGFRFAAMCELCHARGPRAVTQESAAELWNKRWVQKINGGAE